MLCLTPCGPCILIISRVRVPACSARIHCDCGAPTLASMASSTLKQMQTKADRLRLAETDDWLVLASSWLWATDCSGALVSITLRVCRGCDVLVNTPTRLMRRGSIAAAYEQMGGTHDVGGSMSGSIVNAENCGAARSPVWALGSAW